MKSFDPRDGASSEGSYATVYLCSDGELRLFDFWGEEYDFSEKPNKDNPLLLFITDPYTSDGNSVNFGRNSYSIPEKFYGPLSGKLRASLNDGGSK